MRTLSDVKADSIGMELRVCCDRFLNIVCAVIQQPGGVLGGVSVVFVVIVGHGSQFCCSSSHATKRVRVSWITCCN